MSVTKKKRVLFICIHNSARSQMAAAFLKEIGGDRFEVESAGLEDELATQAPSTCCVPALKQIGRRA